MSLPLPLILVLQYAPYLSYASMAMWVWMMFGDVPIIGRAPRWTPKLIIVSLAVSLLANVTIFSLSNPHSGGALFNAILNGALLWLWTSGRFGGRYR